MSSKTGVFYMTVCFCFIFGGMFNIMFDYENAPLELKWLIPVDEDFVMCQQLIAENLHSQVVLIGSTYFLAEYSEHFGMNCSTKCVYLPSTCRRFESLVNKADAVVFHSFRPDLVPALRELLSYRPYVPESQIWLFFSLETIDTLERLAGGTYWPKLNSVFNWSFTYRRDSDVYVPPLTIDGFENAVIDTHRVLIPSLTPIQMANRRHIAAIISNCRDSAGRLALLNELSNLGLTVDIYGACSPNGLKCPGSRGAASGEYYSMLDGKYLFYASFENSICGDYVTEKFFAVLQHNFIPIVLGGANYSAEAPPNSFIDVRDFKSARHLASFLLEVAGDPVRYNSYFTWKTQFRLKKSPDNSPMCSLCRKLHQKELIPKKSLNIEEWWVKGSRCDKSSIFHE